VLAIDVSRSMDESGWEIQREGYARAFESSEVASAMAGGRYGKIAVTFVQWADFKVHKQYGGWVTLSAETAYEYAGAIRHFEYLAGDMTSIEGALSFCTDLIERAPFVATRRIIDISGDGKNNQSFENGGGQTVLGSREVALEKGIVINGLPILGRQQDIGTYYAEEVIGGADAFSLLVSDPMDIDIFTHSIILKLSTEIASR
jgi:hypothetical protein